MASTNYKTRIIFKPHTEDETDFSGTYNLLVAAKSMPAPMSAPNTVESTTMEDSAQTYKKGIKTSDAKEITGNLEKEYLDAVDEVGDEKVDIIQLYGTDGVGGVAKYAYVGQISATPTDVDGTDAILEMSITAIPNTVPVKCTDDYAVTDNYDGAFTVTKVSGN